MKRIMTLGIAGILSVGMTACAATEPTSTGKPASAKQESKRESTPDSTPIPTIRHPDVA